MTSEEILITITIAMAVGLVINTLYLGGLFPV